MRMGVSKQAASPTLPGGSVTRVQTTSFLILISAHFIVDCVGQMWTIFKKLEQLDLAKAGLMFAGSIILAQFLQPLFGMIADRGYRRSLMLAGVALAPATMLVGSFGRNPALMHSTVGYAAMFLLIFASRLGSALFHPAAASAVGDGDPRRRHAKMGLFVASGMAGMALGQGIFSQLYTATDKHSEWIFVPIVGFMFLAFFYIRPPVRCDVGPVSIGTLWHELGSVRHRLLPLWALQVLSGTSIISLHFLLPELVEERGSPAGWVHGGAFFILMAGTALMAPLVGQAADRFGRRPITVACLLMGAALYFVVVLGHELPLGLFLVFLFIYGGMHGSVGPLLITHSQYLVSERRSMATGVMMGWAWAVSASGTWMVGCLVRDGGLTHAHALAWLGIPAVVAAVAALLTGGK